MKKRKLMTFLNQDNNQNFLPLESPCLVEVLEIIIQTQKVMENTLKSLAVVLKLILITKKQQTFFPSITITIKKNICKVN